MFEKDSAWGIEKIEEVRYSGPLGMRKTLDPNPNGPRELEYHAFEVFYNQDLILLKGDNTPVRVEVGFEWGPKSTEDNPIFEIYSKALFWDEEKTLSEDFKKMIEQMMWSRMKDTSPSIRFRKVKGWRLSLPRVQRYKYFPIYSVEGFAKLHDPTFPQALETYRKMSHKDEFIFIVFKGIKKDTYYLMWMFSFGGKDFVQPIEIIDKGVEWEGDNPEVMPISEVGDLGKLRLV